MKSHLPATVMTVVLNLLFLSTSFSQEDTTLVQSTRVVLKDGSELIGTVVGQDSTAIKFRTKGGIFMTVPKDQVEEIERVSSQAPRESHVHRDPNATRLLFAPTARALKGGSGYFSISQIFFPFLAVGIADFLTLAGGMSLFPGAESQLFYIAPKITPLQIENLSVAGGLLYMNTTSSNSEGLGVFYGVGTYGNKTASLTGGLGWGFSGDETADKPIVLLGAELLASDNLKFITENWIPVGSDVSLLSFGLRFFGERLAADLGFIYPAGSRTSGFPFIPWVGFAYNFGKRAGE